MVEGFITPLKSGQFMIWYHINRLRFYGWTVVDLSADPLQTTVENYLRVGLRCKTTRKLFIWFYLVHVCIWKNIITSLFIYSGKWQIKPVWVSAQTDWAICPFHVNWHRGHGWQFWEQNSYKPPEDETRSSSHQTQWEDQAYDRRRVSTLLLILS